MYQHVIPPGRPLAGETDLARRLESLHRPLHDTFASFTTPMQDVKPQRRLAGGGGGALTTLQRAVASPLYRIWLQLGVVLLLLMLVDAGFSGDWSRIGAITTEQEAALRQVGAGQEVGWSSHFIGIGTVCMGMAQHACETKHPKISITPRLAQIRSPPFTTYPAGGGGRRLLPPAVRRGSGGGQQPAGRAAVASSDRQGAGCGRPGAVRGAPAARWRGAVSSSKCRRTGWKGRLAPPGTHVTYRQCRSPCITKQLTTQLGCTFLLCMYLHGMPEAAPHSTSGRQAWGVAALVPAAA